MVKNNHFINDHFLKLMDNNCIYNTMSDSILENGRGLNELNGLSSGNF